MDRPHWTPDQVRGDEEWSFFLALVPDSLCLRASVWDEEWTVSYWTPDQVRGDEEWAVLYWALERILCVSVPLCGTSSCGFVV
jgi:hypothetical protein